MTMTLSTFHSSKPVPVPIPLTDLERENDISTKNKNFYLLTEDEDVDSQYTEETDEHLANETHSVQSIASEEEFSPIPDGSPTFTAVMNELGSCLSKTSICNQIQIPVITCTNDETHFPHKHDSRLHVVKFLDQVQPHKILKKRPNGSVIRNREVRARSNSWNVRSKLEADKRKKFFVSFQSDADSTQSSPAMTRAKNKSKKQSTSIQPKRSVPKYRILTENITVSHEDIIKQQERERHLAEGLAEVKSIFQTRYFDRLRVSPNYVL